MSKKVQFISVLIPCFNVENTIVRALNSVKDQNWSVPYEIICVNNNSTDKTLETILEWQNINKIENFKLLNQDRKGIVPTLNFGIFNLSNVCEMDNHFIARQDGDDVWLPNKIEKQIFELENKDLDIVGCQIRVLDKITHKLKYETSHPVDHDKIVFGMRTTRNYIPHPAVVFRRSIFLRIGIYDDIFKYAEDMWLWAKAIKYFKLGNVNEILLNYYSQHNPEYDHRVPSILSSVFNTLP
jgi:glycosyltransferase involved in cell wall biosynthesis